MKLEAPRNAHRQLVSLLAHNQTLAWSRACMQIQKTRRKPKDDGKEIKLIAKPQVRLNAQGINQCRQAARNPDMSPPQEPQVGQKGGKSGGELGKRSVRARPSTIWRVLCCCACWLLAAALVIGTKKKKSLLSVLVLVRLGCGGHAQRPGGAWIDGASCGALPRSGAPSSRYELLIQSPLPQPKQPRRHASHWCTRHGFHANQS